ncbi:MAG: hypothetical protein V4813_14945 [Gemmatimonadota bacterium]
MRFVILHAGQALGGSDLPELDAGMGVACGAFVPAHGYASVRSVFRKYADAHRDDGTIDEAMLSQMQHEIQALALQVVAADGAVLAHEWAMIYDFSEETGADDYSLDVCLASRNWFSSYWPESLDP